MMKLHVHSSAHNPPVDSARLLVIDALRAVACLAVFWHHVGLYWMRAFWRGWPAVLPAGLGISRGLLELARLGFLGMNLFLVLSGFCLYYPLTLQKKRDLTAINWQRFFFRRVVRIVPAYAASLGILVAISHAPSLSYITFGPVTTKDVWTHLLLIHNFFTDTIWTINGVYWTLALEWQLYFLFPLCVIAARYFSIRTVGFAAAGISLLWPYALRTWWGRYDATGTTYGVWYGAVPAHLFEFVAGMIAAVWARHGSPIPLVFLRFFSLVWLPVAYYRHVVNVWFFPVDNVVCGIGFASGIVLLARARRVNHHLVTKILAHIGVITYSLYLVHQPLLIAVLPWLQAKAWELETILWLALLVGMPIILLVSFGFYFFFEKPFLIFLKSKAKKIY